MKNLNLIKRLWTDSHEKQSPQRFARYAAMLIILLTLGVGQMWGAYYITGSNGNLTGWGTWDDMTESSDGMFWYFQAKSGDTNCKINTSKSYTGALNDGARSSGFCDTDLGGNTWTDDDKNINYWYNSGSYYILVYKPNTTVNNTNSAKVCASTFLPDAGYETTGNTMKYYSNKAATDQTTSALDRDNGSTTALGTVTTLYLKGFNSKMWRHGSGNIYGASDQHYYYKVHRTAVAAGSTGFTDAKNASTWSAGSWSWGSWSSNYSYPTYSGTLNENLLSGLGSGNYTMSYYYLQEGSKNFRHPSDGTKFNKLTWTIAVPAMGTHTCTSDGSGDGSSGTPFSVAVGEDLTITVSGTQASSDANSSLYVSFDGGDTYSSTNTYVVENITSSKLSLSIKAKYYNSADDLSGTVYDFGTIYYQGTLTPSLAISSFTQNASTVTAANSGSSVTINASRQNAGSATITYAYSTDNSNWTTIASTTSTSQSWTLPAVTSTTTYYVKASMTYDATGYSDTETFTVYGKKTIKVKDTNNWGANFKIHRWGGDASGTEYPGETTNITSAGGQWKQVVLYSSSTDFIFCNGSSSSTADANKTANKTYAGMTDGYCYVIQSGSGASLTLTSTDCPEAPSVTTAAATSVGTTSVQFNASSVSANNDAITAYGFAWGTTDACSSGTVTASNLGGGTSFSASKSSLTNGTTYYFKAYATNGQGTTYGSAVSVRTKFITTVTLDQEGGSDGTEEMTATEGSAMPSGATAPGKSGYTFGGYYASAGGSGKKYYNANMTSANNWDVAASTATIHAKWTANNYTITLNDNEGSGGVGSATVTFDHNNFAFASSFVAPERTGYIFQGYFNASDMAYGEKLIDVDGTWLSDEYEYYIDEDGNWVYPNNYTLYAGWTPITYTVTYHANGGSAKDEQSDPTVTNWTYGVAQYISVPSSYFDAPTKYTLFSDDSKYWNDSEHGDGTDYAWGERSNLTSTDGDNIDLYAQWYTQVTLDKNHDDASTNGSMRVRYNQHVTYQMILPTRVGYHRSGFYTTTDGGTKAFEADGTMVSGDVSGFIDDGYWIHTFASSSDPYPTFYTHWDQNHYDLTFDANDCAAYVGEATGSKASLDDVAYETYVDITAGTLAREGYTFAGWSKTECATSATYIGDTWRRISHVDGDDVTLYAVWSPNTYTISFNGQGAYYVGEASRSIRMGDNYGTRDGYTSSLPTASKSGYEFLGWYTRPNGAGTHVTDETQMTTASDHTLYAYWAKASRVYFKNTLGWESVYVTWDATWNYNSQDKGAGAKGKTQQLMSHIYGTDIWYKDIPAAILSSWKGNIAFTNIAMDDYEWFDDGQAVYRRDFDSDATMFVPTPNDPNKYTKNKHDAKPGTVYYSTDMIVDEDGSGNPTNYRYKNGYWVRYDELQSGYTVKGSWKWADDHYVERHSLNDSTYVFTIRNLAANTDYWFNLYKHCTTDNDYSSVFKPAADMTSASSDVVFSAQYAGGGDKKMTTTVAGDYTFKFVFSRLGEIRLTIEYPLAVNDYRVVYSYTKGGAQTFASEYIKAQADAVDTISMFIHSADSATARSLYIQKCTTLVAGVPGWNTTYSAIALPTETASGKTSGVYNFRIAQNGSAAATGESIGKYEGNYYIRTDSAAGGWDFYKEYPSSQMTFSEYSLSQTLSAPYSHYYCQYVGNSSTDISYTIATDYSPAICPIQEGDATIGVGNKTLPSGKPASVRFTWNEETNATFRSYLKSAQGEGNKRFLVLHGSDNKVLDADGNTIAGEGAGAEQMHANELLFSDTENWVYELAFKAKPGAQVSIIARYNDVDRYLVGAADAWETIISGGADTKYDIAAVYDFKTNRLITTWIPSGTISDQIKEVDVLIERHNQDGATTITFGKAAVDAEAGSISAKRVIGALRFDYNELVGRVASWTPDTRAKMMFFVSFPFDVNVSDIFGLNTNYGEAFIVQGYNGAKRAEKGFFKGDGTDTFWETLPVDTVMHAGVGYVVTLDNDYFNGDVGHIWDNKRAGDHVYMYFPSANDPEHPVIINSDDKTINVPAHLCTINRTFNSGKLNHKYTDSNWNLMGVPIFQNHTGNAESGTPGAIFTATKEPEDTTSYANPENPAFGYFYVWNTDKTYTIQSAVDFVFKPMHSYMVQYAGDVKFTCAEPVVPSLAPRRTEIKENYNIELQVLNNSGDMLNHTYVELRENAVDSFALNEDIYMMSSNKAVSVYTFAGTYDVAANVLSIGSHVVPVGVIVKQAGTYTFTMPSNFSGTVTLVDTYAQTRTNLNIEDYEVSLPKGTDEERFYLEININKVPTAIDGAKAGEGTLKDGKVHKFIMNDQMYILKDGVLYDARGNRVK